jgi:hypothetical protein
MVFNRIRKTFWGVSDLTPAHKNKTTGVHGVGISEVDSVKKREEADSELARYLADLIKILIYLELIDGDIGFGDDGLGIMEILERLEEF